MVAERDDYYDHLWRERSPEGAFNVAADDARKLRAENAALRSRMDKAEKKAEEYMEDWMSAKYEFGESMNKLHRRVEELEKAAREFLDHVDVEHHIKLRAVLGEEADVIVGREK